MSLSPAQINRVLYLQRLAELRALVNATSTKDSSMDLTPVTIVPAWQQAADFNVWNQVVAK